MEKRQLSSVTQTKAMRIAGNIIERCAPGGYMTDFTFWLVEPGHNISMRKRTRKRMPPHSRCDVVITGPEVSMTFPQKMSLLAAQALADTLPDTEVSQSDNGRVTLTVKRKQP